MEYLMENLWLVWIGVGVIFLIVEMLTTALVSIWFVPAAIITCLISLFVDSIIWQIAIFVILSALFMVVCRKIYNKHIKKTNKFQYSFVFLSSQNFNFKRGHFLRKLGYKSLNDQKWTINSTREYQCV